LRVLNQLSIATAEIIQEGRWLKAQITYLENQAFLNARVQTTFNVMDGAMGDKLHFDLIPAIDQYMSSSSSIFIYLFIFTPGPA